MRIFIKINIPSLTLLCLTMSLVLFATMKVISGGLCCADDAFFADIAKNLAYGVGYGTTTDGEGFKSFDPQIGTGPAIIVPLALMIWLFGNHYWLPGIVAIFYWFSGLLFVFYILNRCGQEKQLRYAGIFFILAVLLIFPYHFEHWFTFLGEVPTSLFVLSSFVVMSYYQLSYRVVAYSSILLSLACLSKNVSGIYYAAYLMFAFAKVIYVEKKSFRVACGYGLFSLSCFSIPLICFEAYKFYILGYDAYLHHARDTLAFTRRLAAPAVSSPFERIARATLYDKAFSERFGFSVLQLALASILSLIVIKRKDHASVLWTSYFLTAGILMSSFWFLFYSIGWPRYLVTTVVLFIALLSLVNLVLTSKSSLIYIASILILLWFFNHQKFPHMFSGFDNGAFVPARRLNNALILRGFIDSEIGSSLFSTQAWPTTADLEYYSSHTNIFRKHSLISQENSVLLVYNSLFAYVDKDGFNKLLKQCSMLNDNYEPYVILTCNPIE